MQIETSVLDPSPEVATRCSRAAYHIATSPLHQYLPACFLLLLYVSSTVRNSLCSADPSSLDTENTSHSEIHTMLISDILYSISFAKPSHGPGLACIPSVPPIWPGYFSSPSSSAFAVSAISYLSVIMEDNNYCINQQKEFSMIHSNFVLITALHFQ